MSARRLRSMLFAAASNERHMEKALAADADAVIFDLEDAVAVSEKPAARGTAARWAAAPRTGGLYVRINGLQTPFAFDDCAAVTIAGVDGFVLPKAESAREIQTIDWLLLQHERQRGLADRHIELLPILETAAGIDRVSEIAAASPRVRCLMFGAGDLSTDLGVPWATENPALLHARALVSLASHAHGLDKPVDTAYVRLEEDDGFRAEARIAKDLGYQGKACIHPRQVALAHELFTPSAEEIAEARKIWEAFTASEQAGTAGIVVDGRFVDYPVAVRARRLLDLA